MSEELPGKVEEIIRLPRELPSGWEKTTLAEAAEIIMGQSPSSEYYNTEGNGLPFFQGKAEFGDLYPEAVKWCSEPGKIAQKDDILISVRAPVGPTNLAPSECCIGRGLAAIRPKNGMPSRYILHYLRSIEKDIDSLGTGTTFKAISGKILREIPIPVAPLDQQNRIVAEIEKQFSRLDEAVANLKRVKTNLKRYKAAVLKAAVEGRLVETEAELGRREGRRFETGEQHLQRILETRRRQWQGKGKYKEPAAPDTTDLPELPEGWVWANVSQVADVASGNTPAGILETVKQTGDVPWFKVGDMNHEENQQIMRHSDAWLSRTEVKELGLRRFSANTVLFPKRGGAIATNKKRRLESTGCADLNVMGITPANELAFYFFAWFDGIDLGSLSDGSNVPQINHKDIEPLPIPIPPAAEQHRIVAEVDRRLSVVREVDVQVDVNLKRADSLRGTVLSDAFQNKKL